VKEEEEEEERKKTSQGRAKKCQATRHHIFSFNKSVLNYFLPFSLIFLLFYSLRRFFRYVVAGPIFLFGLALDVL
jgi:hypothetical protein